MKLKDLKLDEERVFSERINYAKNRIADSEGEIKLHKDKIEELQGEIRNLENSEVKDIKLPFVVDSIWFGNRRVR